MRSIEAVRWGPDGHSVRIIDQRRLPQELVERELRDVDAVCEAIATLAVRGAPAIGVCGALGLVASLVPYAQGPTDAFRRRLESFAARIRAARPTAVNLGWAVDRMLARAGAMPGDAPALLQALRDEASAILEEDRAMCRRIGEHGLSLLPENARVLTHCNAGALATAGIGTALAPVYLAAERGRSVQVWATETRPLLQGGRLTTWELRQAGIDVALITDSMAGSLMSSGRVDLCLVGADRIAANGDVANKIGTYALAVLAKHHGIPFYVAVPTSTLDPATPTGAGIVIEERSPDEVRAVLGHPAVPEDVAVWNPAFDVTPASLVTAIVTDRGVHRPPYDFSHVVSADVAQRSSAA
ncbi:MAG TPA: S-methyl-5-thioribose-1-phosphate isomerase [Gemmatimonadaceae bacterium]